MNKDQNYIFDFGDDFVLNCGDTSGDVETTRAWIRSYMQSGIVVAGNHMGYTYPYADLNGDQNYKDWAHWVHPKNTKNSQVDALCYYFKDGGVKAMSNGIKEYQDVIFIGTTLYTDFKLFGVDNQIACMVHAGKNMNDFRYCKFLDRVKGNTTKIDYFVRDYSPKHHLIQFRVCFGYIRNRLKNLEKQGNKKPVVIVTHFPPLPFCIEDKYKSDPLSAAFASDLRDFIKEHPCIRLWCSGHVHKPYDFIYNGTRFVCEPWGYFNENKFKIENYGKRISFADIKDRKHSWESLLEQEIKEGKVKVYKD